MDEHIYEFAMLRTLGFMKKQLLSLLTLKTLIFSLPGTICGVLLMILFMTAVRITIYEITKFPISTGIDAFTIGLSLTLGLVLPQISNFGPIRSTIARPLRDALDIQRK